MSSLLEFTLIKVIKFNKNLIKRYLSTEMANLFYRMAQKMTFQSRIKLSKSVAEIYKKRIGKNSLFLFSEQVKIFFSKNTSIQKSSFTDKAHFCYLRLLVK